MAPIEVDSRRYPIVLGSDLVRDGMFLEANAWDTGEAIAEVFYSDETHDFCFSAFRPNLPVELVENLMSAARELLPASADRTNVR